MSAPGERRSSSEQRVADLLRRPRSAEPPPDLLARLKGDLPRELPVPGSRSPVPSWRRQWSCRPASGFPVSTIPKS